MNTPVTDKDPVVAAIMRDVEALLADEKVGGVTPWDMREAIRCVVIGLEVFRRANEKP